MLPRKPKQIILPLSLALCIGILLTCQEAQSGKYGFLKKILNQGDKPAKKLAKEIVPSVQKVLAPSDLKKILPKIPLNKITPEMKSIAAKAKEFTDHGPFATKFINSVGEPGEALRQFSRYGKDYVKKAGNVSDTISRHIDDILALSRKTNKSRKLPFTYPDYFPDFKNPAFVNNKFVEILKRTGKKGYEAISEIAKWAKDHPKSTAAGIAFTWYMIDPEGFTEAVHKSGKTIGAFVSTTVSGATEGIGKGVWTGLKENVSMKNSHHIIFGIILLLIFFVRPVRRFVFIPFRIIAKKMDQVAAKFETPPDSPKEKPRNIHTTGPSISTEKGSGSTVFD